MFPRRAGHSPRQGALCSQYAIQQYMPDENMEYEERVVGSTGHALGTYLPRQIRVAQGRRPNLQTNTLLE